jgi:transcriptional regulator
MYVPPSFTESSQQKLHDAIERYSFATLVSGNNEELVASHLPLLLEREVGAHGRLVGHMAESNPQWQHADATSVLAIFRGPHAYISPTWYEAENVVPTWNYVAVHVYGTLRLEDSRERRLAIVRRYVDYYEASMDQPWSLDQVDAEFVDKLLDAIIGFTINIERIEGKWKLNQNHDPARRSKVIQALQETVGNDQRHIAELMSETMEQ